LILYVLGFGYLFNALQLKFDPKQPRGRLRQSIFEAWQRNHRKPEDIKRRMTIWGGLYILAFALVLSLIGFDLVMSMDPHWVSTLFGAYHFVKSFFIGLGALIILAAVIRLKQGEASGINAAHFNYVLIRTMLAPWNKLAWTVFIVCFIGPFFILLNQRIKTRPILMMIICSIVIIGIWLEHLLLLGPALSHGTQSIPLSVSDGLISLGFLGLMVIAVGYFLNVFPETILVKESN